MSLEYEQLKKLVLELNKENEMTTFKPEEFTLEEFKFLYTSIDMSKIEQISERIDDFEIWRFLNPEPDDNRAKMLFGFRKR